MANWLREIADNLDKLNPWALGFLFVCLFVFVGCVLFLIGITHYEVKFYRNTAERLQSKLDLAEYDKECYRMWWRESVEKLAEKEKTK